MGYISRSCDLLRGGISKKGNLMDYVSRVIYSKNREKSEKNYKNYQKRKFEGLYKQFFDATNAEKIPKNIKKCREIQ